METAALKTKSPANPIRNVRYLTSVACITALVRDQGGKEKKTTSRGDTRTAL